MTRFFQRLLKLPDETMVFPAHDYKGDTVSTIGEEKRFNPRLQVRSVDEYVELMNNLNLPNPKLMDVVLPANMHVGLHQDDLAKTRSGNQRTRRYSKPRTARIFCWSTCARAANAPSTACCPARCMRRILPSRKACSPAACCARLPRRPGAASCFLFARFGERSAMAVKAAKDARAGRHPRISKAAIDAWKKAGGPVLTS